MIKITLNIFFPPQYSRPYLRYFWAHYGMTELHCRHLQADIDQYMASTTAKVVDKTVLKQEMADKAHFGRETGRHFVFCGR